MNKRKIVAVIPARMASSRFPGKPLAKIFDLPMIEHVRRRVCLSGLINEVYVATCDNEIKDMVNGYGGKAIMTASTHQRCTDRVKEAVEHIEADLVAIVQGDEPLLDYIAMEKLIQPMLKDNLLQCTNLLSVISDEKDFLDPDVVKAVINNDNYLMYYSRSPIPFRAKINCSIYRQTGLSVFTKEFLFKFSSLSQTEKERVESIDFLRIIDYGYHILGVVYPQRTVGVDRKEDIDKVEKILKDDSVQKAIYERILISVPPA